MSSLFQHFTFGFQQLSKLFHDFTTDSYQIQTYAKNCTIVFQATAQPISAFPLVCNRCSAYFSSLPWVFIYLFPLPGLVFICFFSSVLCLINFHHCVFVFSLFMFIHFHFVHHLFSFWYCLYMVFIVIYIYIASSILIICNCFIFWFHHISYIYIYCCPFPSILFQRDPKTPSRSELLVQKIMYAMHTVCFISCLRLATEQHCTLPQTGVNGKVYLIIPEIKTHTLAEVDEELLRGVKGFGGWVSLLYQNISSNINK